MSSISTHKRLIKLYYSSESSVGKQTLSYLKSSFKNLLAIDVIKTKVTGTQWKTLASKLNLKIGDLIDTQHPSFTSNYDEHTEVSEDDWIKILNSQPDIFNYPIVIFGECYFLIRNPSDIEKYIQPNSKDIKIYKKS